ncbi:MAG: PAS domain-containing sensor histidine kinase [Pseudomonadota bacterium]
MSIAASLLVMLTLLYLQRLQINSRATGYWACAYACVSLHLIFTLAGELGYPWLAMAVDLGLLGFVCCLWLGTRAFNCEPAQFWHPGLLFSALSAWVVLTHLLGVQFVWRAMPTQFFAGGMLLATAYSFWHRHRASPNSGYAILACLIGLWGLHQLDYPFLRPVASFAGFGFVLAALLNFSTGMLLLVAATLDQQGRTAQAFALLDREMGTRKTAEKNLHEREELFEKVFQLVPDVLVICKEKSGRYVEVNRHWEPLTGYSPQETLGRSATELNLWVDLAQRDAMIATMRSLGEFWGLDATLRHKDGHHYFVKVSGVRMNVGDESFVSYTVQDISAALEAESYRNRVEAQLREREAVLATVFQLVPDTLTITRIADGHYIDVNRNWEPLSGYAREEAIGRTSGDLNLWADTTQRQELVRRVVDDGEVRGMHIDFRHKDGHVFHCRVSGSRFVAGDQTYLLLSAQNIDQELVTEKARIQAETLLRENEHKYSTIFQLSPIALGLVNVATSEVVEVNDVWLDQFGYARKDVIGHTALELNFWDRPEDRLAMIEQLRQHDRIDKYEIRHRHKDGHVLICLMSARLFDLEKGKMFIFSLLDVTRQYEIEREIREMTAQLEARVRLRTLKLEQANQELAEAMESLKHAQDELIRSEKMAALGSLVAGVAHELNTPIGNSVTVASTLEDKTRELLRDVTSGNLRRSTLDQYLQSFTSGTALLMRTLNVARELISSFKQVAVDQSSSQRRKFDLQKALEEVIATLSPMYKKGPFSLATDLSPGIGMDSFPGALGQIITNFMTNALAHAFDGRESGEMRLSSRLLDDTHAEIIFADNGAGIREGDQKRVFDPFFTTKLGQGGSGLGMNIVYNLVTGVLGGEIRLDSRLGEGTKFTLRLPLSAPQISADTAIEQSAR